MRAAVGCLALLIAAAAAAQAPRNNTDRRERAPLADVDDLEPAVDVADRSFADDRREVAAAPVATAPTVPAAAAAAAGPTTEPSSQAARARSTTTAAQLPARSAMDTLDLGTTSITGNQELPKVLYIVPWKKSDLGELVGRPVNTLLDEVLEPVDPEVFERHLSYYEALHKVEEE